MKMSKCHDDSKLQRKSAGHGHGEGVAALSSPSPSSPSSAPATKAEEANRFRLAIIAEVHTTPCFAPPVQQQRGTKPRLASCSMPGGGLNAKSAV